MSERKKQWIPWNNVVAFLRMSTHLARYHVKKAKIRTQPIPDTVRYVRYNLADLTKLKEKLRTKSRRKLPIDY